MQCYGNYIEVNKNSIVYLKIDISRNSLQTFLGLLKGAFQSLGVQMMLNVFLYYLVLPFRVFLRV